MKINEYYRSNNYLGLTLHGSLITHARFSRRTDPEVMSRSAKLVRTGSMEVIMHSLKNWLKLLKCALKIAKVGEQLCGFLKC